MTQHGTVPQPSEEDPLLPAAKEFNGSEEAPSFSRLLSMIIFAFPMSVIWATMGMVVLPAEALRLFPNDEAIYLGLMLTVTAFAQLICPLAGQMSDRHRSVWGKRRPYILVGTMLSCMSIAGLWYTSKVRMAELFFVSLFFSQCGLNIIDAVQASIVPDNFSKDKGTVSGMVSLLRLAGNFAGMIWIICTFNMDFHYAYGTHLVLLTAAALVVCQVKERATDKDPEEILSFKTLWQSYLIDLNADWDFFLVFIGRMFFYMALSCQTFIYYYFRDMMNVKSESLVRFRLAVLCLIATFVGMLASYPLGQASDNPNVGRKNLIYYSCATMASCYVGYCVVPLAIGPNDTGLYVIYGLGALYGLGFACYLAVDYALALDCLPESTSGSESNNKGSSEALGLWGIAGFAGSMLGPLLGGTILQLHVMPGGGYTPQGYALMLSVGIVSFFLSALVTSFIKRTD